MRFSIWATDRNGNEARKRPLVHLVPASLIFVIVLAACGAATDDNGAAPDADANVSPQQNVPAAQPAQAPAPVVQQVLTPTPQPSPAERPVESSTQSINIVYDFQIDDVYSGADKLGGETVAFSSLFGGDKPIILNFWAGLCPPCRAEMPDFQAAYEEFGDDVLLFGLDVGPFVGLGSNQQGRDLVEELNVSYPTGTTKDATVARAYQLFSMPSTIFMKPNGEVVTGWPGPLTKKKLMELTQELLEKSGT